MSKHNRNNYNNGGNGNYNNNNNNRYQNNNNPPKESLDDIDMSSVESERKDILETYDKSQNREDMINRRAYESSYTPPYVVEDEDPLDEIRRESFEKSKTTAAVAWVPGPVEFNLGGLAPTKAIYNIPYHILEKYCLKVIKHYVRDCDSARIMHDVKSGTSNPMYYVEARFPNTCRDIIISAEGTIMNEKRIPSPSRNFKILASLYGFEQNKDLNAPVPLFDAKTCFIKNFSLLHFVSTFFDTNNEVYKGKFKEDERREKSITISATGDLRSPTFIVEVSLRNQHQNRRNEPHQTIIV